MVTSPSIRLTKSGVYLGIRRIASPITYHARGTRSWDDTKVAEIRFRDSEGRDLIERFGLAEFQPRNRHKVVDRLANRGYEWPTEIKPAQLVEVLAKQPPVRKFTIVNAPGWHDGNYVTARWCATKAKKHPQRYRLDQDSGAHIAPFTLGDGSLDQWKETVAKVARHSAPLRLFISAAFAAPLLRHLDIDSFGLNLFGDTSLGKTTCEFAAASVSGIIQNRTLPGWADSGPAIEQLAVGHRDGILPLDDAGDEQQISPEKKARSIAFAIARNRPRTLDKRYQNASSPMAREYRVIILSSSESSFGELARAVGKKRLGGEEVRLIDVPCEGMQGIFDKEIEPERAREIIDLLKVHSEANQGYALREFLRQFLRDDVALSKLKTSMQIFESGTAINASDTAQLRMRKSFAVLYAAAALAIEYDILPWKETATLKAISFCMDGAIRARGSSAKEPKEVRTATTVVQTLKGELVKLNLVKVTKRKQLASGEAELRDRADGFDFGNEIYVKPSRWTGISEGNRQELVRLNILKTERSDVSTVARKLKGIAKKQRYHVINTAALKALPD